MAKAATCFHCAASAFSAAAALASIHEGGVCALALHGGSYFRLLHGWAFMAHSTEFGRTVYAIGGSTQSAMLMGLPVARTTVLVYSLSGFARPSVG